MSDEFDDDETDDNDGSSLVKDLRRQLKAVKKERDDLASVADQFKAEQRKSSVTKALEARGANPKLARFYDSEDSTPEAIETWISENADLFGIPEAESAEDAATAAAAARVSAATSTAGSNAGSSVQDLNARLLAAQTPAEADAILQQLGTVKVPR